MENPLNCSIFIRPYLPVFFIPNQNREEAEIRSHRGLQTCFFLPTLSTGRGWIVPKFIPALDAEETVRSHMGLCRCLFTYPQSLLVLLYLLFYKIYVRKEWKSSANPPWEDDTRTGAYGAGSLGTAEKGAYWLKVAIAEKAGHVAEIQEQYRRRCAAHNQSSEGSITSHQRHQ